MGAGQALTGGDQRRAARSGLMGTTANLSARPWMEGRNPFSINAPPKAWELMTLAALFVAGMATMARIALLLHESAKAESPGESTQLIHGQRARIRADSVVNQAPNIDQNIHYG
jgi:hypothetical protein